jgi:Domain of unknown function (DUF4381)
MNPAVDPSVLPLRDIHLPTAVAWWPPAPGWWLVAALLGALAIWGALRWYRQRAKRAALKAIAAAARALGHGESPIHCVQQLSATLRRYAITAQRERDAVAGLAGEPWLAYLDSRWRRRAFSAGPGRQLAVAPYAASVSAEQARELSKLCIAWLKAQRC